MNRLPVQPEAPPATTSRLTTFTAVAAVLAAMGLTAAESAFGSADAAANAAIQAGSGIPCGPFSQPTPRSQDMNTHTTAARRSAE